MAPSVPTSAATPPLRVIGFNVISFGYRCILSEVAMDCGDVVGPATSTLNHQGFTPVWEVFPECFLCIV